MGSFEDFYAELHPRLIAALAATCGDLDLARDAVAHADIIIANLLFIEEHITAIRDALEARRNDCDAMVGVIADPAIVKLTRMGDLDMTKPASGAMALLKKLRGSSKPSASCANA